MVLGGIKASASDKPSRFDDLVDRVNVLEAQMPQQLESARVHTLLFALHLSMQETILKMPVRF